jgi:hypothetical protein
LLDILVPSDQMFGQKLTTFEFFLAQLALPDVLNRIFGKVLGVSNILFDLFTEHDHILRGLHNLFNLFLHVLLDLLEDSLSIREFFVICFGPQEA